MIYWILCVSIWFCRRAWIWERQCSLSATCQLQGDSHSRSSNVGTSKPWILPVIQVCCYLLCLCLYFLSYVCLAPSLYTWTVTFIIVSKRITSPFIRHFQTMRRQGERYVEKLVSHLPALLADPYVKVSLICDGRRLKKKKTSIKKNTLNPTYNEAIIFDIPPENMDQVCLHISVMDYDLWVLFNIWYFLWTNIMLSMCFTIYSLFSWCVEWDIMRSLESVV